MATEIETIVWFDQCCNNDTARVGGKCASLGELLQACIRVPPGFAVTTDAYHEFLHGAGIAEPIYKLLRETRKGLPIPEAGAKIRAMIEGAQMPVETSEAIKAAYRELGARCGDENLPVAVRSSATAEDMIDASFAGQQDTYLWVCGEDDVVKKVVSCWASLFSDRVISYREERKIAHEDVKISVGVQKMVRSRSSGVLFTLNPINGDRSKIAINSAWGFGEGVVSGDITPDDFLVDKVTRDILTRHVVAKPEAYRVNPDGRGVALMEVPEAEQKKSSVSDEEIKELANLARAIEKHYGRPMDVEWGVDADLPFPENILILQARPETVWSAKKMASVSGEKSKTALESILGNLMGGVAVKFK